MVDVNRLIEPDTKQLGPKNECGGIRYITVTTLYNIEFYFWDRAGLNAARSETLVAGLKLVLAFLQPKRRCVYRF